jgi:two-component system response regulator AtoC
MLPERKQVLIVDDEPNLRKILSAQLSRDGYDVLTAEDGEQGWPSSASTTSTSSSPT